MDANPPDLRAFMRNAPQAVSVVTAAGEGGPRGITVSAFFSVSVEPPLMLISIGRAARAHPAIRRGSFRIHLLADDQAGVSNHFARPGLDSAQQFPDHAPDGIDPPRIPNCVAWADCRIVSAHDEADHTLFVGRVTASRVERPDARPLLYQQGSYRTVGPAPA